MGFFKQLYGRVAMNSVGIETINPYVGMLLEHSGGNRNENTVLKGKGNKKHTFRT